MAAICAAAVQRLAGAESAVETAAPDFTGAIDCFRVERALLVADGRGGLLPAAQARINPDIVWNIEKGLALTAEKILQARRSPHALFHRVARFFDRFDRLAYPTVAVPPFPVERRVPTEIAGAKLASYIDGMCLTFVITLTGCPAISLPCGMTASGLPVGLQLVGRPQGDAELLGQARLVEEALAFPARVLPG